MKQARVVNISYDCLRVSLSVGTVDNVSEGDKFLVYSLSEHEIIDPETTESLGRLELVKGTGRVIHVQDKMCTIESDMYEDSSTTTITKRQDNSIASFYHAPYTEKITPSKKHVPFDSPLINDYAKPV